MAQKIGEMTLEELVAGETQVEVYSVMKYWKILKVNWQVNQLRKPVLKR